jgi:predicted Rossmann-fold nucleotide-binding protein
VLREAVGGFLVLPGGFGTLDELSEALTLSETRKVPPFPVVLLDSDHWVELVGWLRSELLNDAMISTIDLVVLHVTDDHDEAVEIVVDSFVRRNGAR